MPENEFEKKVSSELQGLRLKPSDEVWQKVEERIRRKKRRRVFFILFFAGLALLGWWQWDNFFGEKKTDLVKTETPAEKKETPVEKTGTLPSLESKMEVEPSLPAVRNESPILPETGKEKLSTAKESITIKEPSVGKNIAATSKEKQIPVAAEKISAVTEKPVDAALPVEKSETGKQIQVLTKKDEEVKKEAVEERVVKIEPIPADTVVGKKVGETKEEKKIVAQEKAETKKADPLVLNEMKADTTAVIPPMQPLSRNKKWKWGIEFTPGLSTLDDQFLTLGFAKSAELISSPAGGSAGTPQPRKPSKHTAGFAFQLGGYAIKQLTHRSSLSAGVRFAYYSDVIRIGNRRNNFSSTISQYLDAQGASNVYSAGDTNSFTNRYHFIELPLTYYVRLGKNETHPFTLQTGIKAGRLFSANALVYDTVAYGIYYNSNKHLNKIQLGLTLGLSKTILNKEKYQWAIGPVADIHVSSLLNNPLEKKKYLLFTGIRTSVIFSSKK